jgi:FlaA1/EpsC-like NDP-sugar epimerase
MILLKSNTPRWVISFLDLFISLFSLAFAYLIRFDLKANETLIATEWEILYKSLPVYILVKWTVFYLFQVHKGLVRHTSTEDLKRIFYAISISSVLFLIFGLIRWKYLDGYFLFPSSVLVMEFLVSFFLIISLRFSVKLIYLESIKNKENKQRVLIYGAGVSGLITKRTIEKDSHFSYEIVGFVDDNPKIKGTRLEGVKIFHASQTRKLIKSEGVTELIIAIQNPNEVNRKEIVEICLEEKVKVQQVPSAQSWINGEFSTKQINKIRIEDLLGRKPIVLNADKIAQELKDKVVLVTGAAGSIGSGIVRQIADYEPNLIVILDQAESQMYDFQNELKFQFPNLHFEVVIGDIRNKERMNHLFETYKPAFVYHAAAYKHVPLMEDNPSEAVVTNIGGTKNLVDLAIEYQVEKFVMISTDKAVNPTNVMGASKRIAEMYAQTKNGGFTKFITTRFGNVLGSNGSVIPLFKKQIEQGGPLTVTDANVTRFFMTIPEACQLVLEAGNMGKGGEIFVFDMGESVKIIDLAKKMIQLSGLEEGKDIEIKVTGLRPGEKLYEELLASEENTMSTYHPQILIAKIRPLSEEILPEIENLIQLFHQQDNKLIVSKMKSLVPEFISNNSEFSKLDK